MSSQLINQVVELTNAERAKAGLNPLTLNNQLAQAAQGHSDSMAADDFFNHTGADGSDVSDRVEDTGYQYSRTGENIAAGQTTAEQVVQGWMDSPGHRANILNPDFTEIGIGYEFLEDDTGSVNYNHYWTQVFGTPLGNNNSSGVNNQPDPAPEVNNSPDPVAENNDNLLEPETSDSPTTNPPEVASPDPVEVVTENPVDIPEVVPEVVEPNNGEASTIEVPEANSSGLENTPERTNNLSDMDNLESDLFGTANDYSMESTGNENLDYLMNQVGDLLMSGGVDAINFTDSSELVEDSSFSYSNSFSSSNLIDLAEISSLGSTASDFTDYESLIMEYVSSFDLNPQQQEQIIETLESLF